jgi:hypothetical protein
MTAQPAIAHGYRGIHGQIAAERALNDYTLQPGDIVSTEKGLLQFRGWAGADGRDAQFSPVAPR